MVQRITDAGVGFSGQPLMLRHLPLPEEDLDAIPAKERINFCGHGKGSCYQPYFHSSSILTASD